MNTDAKRYYALLGLDPLCSDEDIRSAFRRRAKELHPDAESGDATAFIYLKRAYDTLSDPARRANYDRVSNPRVRRAMRAARYAPPPPRVRAPRPGGMSFRRYFVAFLFVGGLSFGAIEAMISSSDVPYTTLAHPVTLLATSLGAVIKEEPKATTSTKAWGLWDPTSRDGTPRDETAESEPTPHRQASSIGALSPD